MDKVEYRRSFEKSRTVVDPIVAFNNGELEALLR